MKWSSQLLTILLILNRYVQFYHDDGTEFNPELIAKPGLCIIFFIFPENLHGWHSEKNRQSCQHAPDTREPDTEEVPLIELEFGVDGLPTVFKSDEDPRVAEIRMR